MLELGRLTLEELHEEARKQGIVDVADVRLGVLEPDGKMSFLGAEDDRHQSDDHEAA